MKDIRPPYSRIIGDARHFFCSTCDAYREEAHFYPTAVAKKARCCKACWNEKQRLRRASSVLARMLHSVRVRIRAQGGDHELARAWELSDVEDVLRRHGHGKPYGGGLCLVQINPTAPLRPDNARPMPTRCARGRHHRRPPAGTTA